MKHTEEVLTIRAEIDEIDAQILVLLARRFDRVRRMGELKTSAGSPLRDTAREKQILLRLTEINLKLQKDVPQECLEEIFQSIMDWGLKIQQKNGY